MKNNKTDILSGYNNDLYLALTNAAGVDKTHLVLTKIMQIKKNNKKIIFIGNGGSSAIASHMAVDFWKNGRINAVSFNDPAMLTCLSNDLGYENVFAKPIERFAEKGDMLFAVSSSGKSPNILNGAKAARKKGLFIVTLSGFKSKNPLRKLGDINIYIPSLSYGIVETAHQFIIHSLLDHIMSNRKP